MKKKTNTYPIKKYLFLKISTLLIVFSTNVLRCQEVEITYPMAVVEYIPLFPDCEKLEEYEHMKCFKDKMKEHINNNFHFPKEAMEKGLQGRVAIVFIIQKDGVVANIRARGPNKILEEAAMEIFEKLPKMIPGRNEEGKAVTVSLNQFVKY